MLENLEADRFLNQAYADGALKIPPSLQNPFLWDPPSAVLAETAQALEAERHTAQPQDQVFDQFNDPGRDTRRILYQDVYYLVEHDRTPILPGLSYEIARFIAAPDEVGIVKKCSTWLGATQPPAGVQPPDPLDPYYMDRIKQIEGFWYLRLWQNTFQPMPRPDNGIALGAVGGYGFPELPSWSDNRFQWNNNDGQVFWIVPSNHALRLYFHLIAEPDERLKEIQGRLVGFTQPIDTMPASKNVLYAW